MEYGTPRQIRSYNFFVLNFHEFVDMWRDVLASGSRWQRLKHFWMPPGWERPGHTPIHTWTVERKERNVPGGPGVRSPGAAPDHALVRRGEA